MEQTYVEKSQSVIEQAEALVVTDQTGYEVAAAQVGALSDLEKQIKSFYGPKKNAAKAPWDALVKEEKELLAKPSQAKQILRAKMSAYHRKQEEEREREQQRLRTMAEEQGLSEEADGALLTVPKMEQPEGVSQRKVWKFRVTDETKVPKQYWVLDEKAIRALVRSQKDKAKIPGIEVYYEWSTVVR